MMIKRVYKNLKCIMLLLLWLACSTAVLAQQRQISGSVKDANGDGLPGVSVVVKGTTTGTTTNAEGRFSISATNDATLILSFIGYVTQEAAIGNRATVDVTLAEDVMQLGEVVVTALGVERSQKALQSSITKVPGMSLTQARENNLGSSIQGRVAGVNVSTANTGPAGSSRVIIRGAKSVGSNNQPLYVIDGIPMDNTQFGRSGVWGGTDSGDGLTSMNPDDIESVTILKGAAAAALYGSRGGYGVINITTKKGATKKGLGIEFNSNYVFEKINDQRDLQHEYGPGGLRYSVPTDPTSERIWSTAETQLEAWGWGSGSQWGPRMDGQSVMQFDGVMRPYSYAGDNWKRYFETGNSWTNNLSISGGGDNQTFRFSFSDLKSNFVIPNSGFYRKNVSLSTNGKFGKRLTFNAKVMYSNERMKNRTMVSDSPGNPISAMWLLPNTLNIDNLKGDPNKLGAVPVGVTTPDLKVAGEEYQQADNNWQQNPWWCAYQFKNENIRDRFITSGNMRYDITDWLYIQGQVGMDWYTRNNSQLVPQGTGYLRGGSKNETSNFVREVNQEFLLGADKEFGKVRVNGFFGGNKMVHEYEAINANGSTFNVPFFESVNNTQSQSFGYGYNKSGINSLYGSAEISYAGYLYITATGREDWFSVLNPANNHMFYPSLGGSFVFSDAFTLPDWLSFGKLRAAWGQVATANVGTYAASVTYGLTGQGHLGIPMAGFSGGTNIPNPNLNPALSSEIEFGTEMRFFNGRAGLEFTYYSQKTTDDILSATISRASGFQTTSVNIGELQNKGIELLLTGTPVQGAITWDISFNFAHNKNEVIALSEGVLEMFVEEPRTRTVAVYNIVGQPFGMIKGFKQLIDPATGKKVYDINGIPQRTATYEVLGNGVAKLTGGMNNSLSWKRIKLDALLDFKFGGDIYSGTNVRLTQAGFHKQTVASREAGVDVEGVYQTGTATDGSPVYSPISLNTKTDPLNYTGSYWSNYGERTQENFMYDASFVKLRQVSLEYSLPASIVDKTPLQTIAVSFVGRNLAVIYKNIENIDPEAGYTDSNGQGLDYYGMPAVRSYGFNIRLVF
ncbi:MAG TPA: SusC/RagA family TonB-linked outer membrane protein [Bacteroidales bacterium]|nr:SusC/RagA family TonB-linked outer membrane protein [Bacteroidales bacterium]